jgi:hypothetical protein
MQVNFAQANKAYHLAAQAEVHDPYVDLEAERNAYRTARASLTPMLLVGTGILSSMVALAQPGIMGIVLGIIAVSLGFAGGTLINDRV